MFVTLDVFLVATNATDGYKLQITDVRVPRLKREVFLADTMSWEDGQGWVMGIDLAPHTPTMVRCMVVVRDWSPGEQETIDQKIIFMDQYGHRHPTPKIRFKHPPPPPPPAPSQP